MTMPHIQESKWQFTHFMNNNKKTYMTKDEHL
jgi:hypothetical protein